MNITVVNMSTEEGALPHTDVKKLKKHKNSGVEKKEKKRKRQASEDLELNSPTKKHRSKQNGKSAAEHRISTVTQEPPPIPPYYQQTSSLYLPLPPISQRHALKGLCAEHISPLILTYYPPFHGVILSYCNARLSGNPLSETKPVYARSIDEYAASFVWVTADFLVFKPQNGDLIEGWVNLQNESNIGLLCLNFFNATIQRRRMAKGWKWISGGVKPTGKRKLKKAQGGTSSDSEQGDEVTENTAEDAQGFFQDGQGKKIEGLLHFRVKNVETSRSMDHETSFLNIEGTMLSEEDEEKLQEQEALQVKGKGKRQPKYAMSGALADGIDEPTKADQPANLNPSLKHRVKY